MPPSSRWVALCLGSLLALAIPVFGARAAELRIGMSAESTTLDPHALNSNPNNSVRRHIFESLVGQDETQHLRPLLAESWRVIDDTTWEFKLRRGVRFHDGSEFTAQDFVYSVCRISSILNSPSGFSVYTRGIDRIDTPDPHTLIVHTAGPYPLLATEFATFSIVSARAAGGMNARFNRDGCTGALFHPTVVDSDIRSLLVGTGPFEVAERVRGDRIVLVRDPDYWGPAPAWDRVILRPIPAAAARVSALLSGEVDMIENPPPQAVARIGDSPDLTLTRAPSNRTIYLSLDHTDGASRGVSGARRHNPLTDVRVREALSLAVNRDAVVGGIMSGGAVAASQLIPPGFFGHNDAIHLAYDPPMARRLLAEAGYRDGFSMVLGAPNDRYVNDERVAQAVAQMLNRIGIRVTVEASTWSVHFPRAKRNEFAASLIGWGAATGEASSALKAVVTAHDEARGFGTLNYGGYSNAAVEATLLRALAVIDDSARAALLGEAMKIAIDDFAVIPLYHEFAVWALRKSLVYKARADQLTLAAEVRLRE